MKLMKILTLSAVAAVVLAGTAVARDQIMIVGSSTVFPFSSAVAEEFGATTKYQTPVVESTGSGGGHKLFGVGVGEKTPDITNSSRKMKKSEFERALENGVDGITEVMIGYDGIALAHHKDNPELKVSRKDIFLAVAKLVPVNGELVENPYKMWQDINPALPAKPIRVYGPPTSSGTRDAFHELVMHVVAKKYFKDVYVAYLTEMGAKKPESAAYDEIRDDGAYIDAGENDNLIVQRLEKDSEAVGIFGFSFLDENRDKIQGAIVDGVVPEPTTISSGEYPISRSLFFYVKQAHLDVIDGMEEFVNLFVSEKMIGDRGRLKRIGLIPLPKDMREQVREDVKNWKKMTLEDF